MFPCSVFAKLNIILVKLFTGTKSELFNLLNSFFLPLKMMFYFCDTQIFVFIFVCWPIFMFFKLLLRSCGQSCSKEEYSVNRRLVLVTKNSIWVLVAQKGSKCLPFFSSCQLSCNFHGVALKEISR